MKRMLYLARHAKAYDAERDQRDYERQLQPEGMKDASRMGKKLSQRQFSPDIILSSGAPRALDTARLFAEQLDHYDYTRIRVDDEIYEASTRTLLQVINKLEPQWQTAMIVGHNPSLSYLAEYLTKHDIGNMEKCAIVQIQFDLDTWAQVSEGKGTFVEYLSKPREGIVS